jgi:hypothetical protein
MSIKVNSQTVVDNNSQAFLANTTINGGSFVEYGVYIYPPMYGTVSGYNSGGFPGPSNVIDKFPFATNANATDVGDLTVARTQVSGQSSEEFGYASGGSDPAQSNVIDKFPFAADGNATDVGDLTVSKNGTVGQSSLVSGYVSSGLNSGSFLNQIDKFLFAADANATDVGDLTQGRYNGSGQSSLTFGYTSGGYVGFGVGQSNVIDKFPFAADANATDVGDLVNNISDRPAGHSSSTSGYSAGGYGPSVPINSIYKFSFATDSNATDIADLTRAAHSLAGQSSSEFGYTSGGFFGPPSFAVSNIIDKFPFAADANATDVGDLTSARGATSGQQD